MIVLALFVQLFVVGDLMLGLVEIVLFWVFGLIMVIVVLGLVFVCKVVYVVLGMVVVMVSLGVIYFV